MFTVRVPFFARTVTWRIGPECTGASALIRCALRCPRQSSAPPVIRARCRRPRARTPRGRNPAVRCRRPRARTLMDIWTSRNSDFPASRILRFARGDLLFQREPMVGTREVQTGLASHRALLH